MKVIPEFSLIDKFSFPSLNFFPNLFFEYSSFFEIGLGNPFAALTISLFRMPFVIRHTLGYVYLQ